ncbi:unnamed protein product [Protopolystoma xenopodis]|uniref:Vacuolar sorting protein 39/Transforming growth factor beta receptor-associated domain-containing protein n=1 Tax=Protopolystoma xenopodis TaxID=117903 RepID=A0A3S4ZW10_9PLAT|nr:unnamed protein product [Protopolystoma xenopodis]
MLPRILNSQLVDNLSEPLITYLVSWRRRLSELLESACPRTRQHPGDSTGREFGVGGIFASAIQWASSTASSDPLSSVVNSCSIGPDGVSHTIKISSTATNTISPSSTFSGPQESSKWDAWLDCFSLSADRQKALQSSDTCPKRHSARLLLEVIDTSLLKCYLATNAARVGPLLRCRNYCHLGESERVLTEYMQYEDLVVLYQTRGLHEKALSLLRLLGEARLAKRSAVWKSRQYNDFCRDGELSSLSNSNLPSDSGWKYTDSSLSSSFTGHPGCIVKVEEMDQAETIPTTRQAVLERISRPAYTVAYLRGLGPEHFRLVAEYAGWILGARPAAWMRIFSAWERAVSEQRCELNKSTNSGIYTIFMYFRFCNVKSNSSIICSYAQTLLGTVITTGQNLAETLTDYAKSLS